jgi:hypothetical protein
MTEIPNLAGIATKDLVEQIGSSKFSASYINWARTINLLHQHAPGWMVNYVTNNDGDLVHKAPGMGGYLLIGFEHVDGTSTPPLPQAVMDHRNNPIPFDKISARDITDTQRRGMCMAAAMTFGLAYELWAKMPLESGYAAPEPSEEETQQVSRPASKTITKTAAQPADPAKVPDPEEQPLTEDEKKLLQGLIKELSVDNRNAFLDQFRREFDMKPNAKVAYAITKKKHEKFIQDVMPKFV